MGRADLERLSKDELIELVLRLQRPEKTSRTSSKPPSTDRKERREQARPGGAKPGHEGHSRTLAQDPDRVIEHRPACCPDCGLVLPPDLPAETVSTHEHTCQATPRLTRYGDTRFTRGTASGRAGRADRTSLRALGSGRQVCGIIRRGTA